MCLMNHTDHDTEHCEHAGMVKLAADIYHEAEFHERSEPTPEEERAWKRKEAREKKACTGCDNHINGTCCHESK